jgi:hypothetical protein
VDRAMQFYTNPASPKASEAAAFLTALQAA